VKYAKDSILFRGLSLYTLFSHRAINKIDLSEQVKITLMLNYNPGFIALNVGFEKA